MSNYVSPAEAAKQIRETLKRVYGISNRQVSVRSESYSLGSSLCVGIHDPGIGIREIENVASPQEAIDRCEMTGEILGGGNRFLHVSYSRRAKQAVLESEKDRIEKIQKVARELPKERTEKVEGVYIQNLGHALSISTELNPLPERRSWINAEYPETIAEGLLVIGAQMKK